MVRSLAPLELLLVGFITFFFVPEAQGYAAIALSRDTGKLYKCMDAGLTWETYHEFGVGTGVRTAIITSNSSVFAIGDGQLWSSVPSEANYTLWTTPSLPLTSTETPLIGSDSVVNALDFSCDSGGECALVAAGDKGFLAVLRNGDWEFPSHMSSYVLPFHSIDTVQGTSNIAISGDAGRVLLSFDLGRTFNMALADAVVTSNLYDVVWLQSGSVIAVGSGGSIARSSSPGTAPFSLVPSGTTAVLLSAAVSSSSPPVVFACGTLSVLLASVDDGVSWSSVSVSASLSLHHFVSLDAAEGYNGVIIGTRGRTVSSVNSGEFWISHSLLEDVNYIDYTSLMPAPVVIFNPPTLSLSASRIAEVTLNSFSIGVVNTGTDDLYIQSIVPTDSRIVSVGGSFGVAVSPSSGQAHFQFEYDASGFPSGNHYFLLDFAHSGPSQNATLSVRLSISEEIVITTESFVSQYWWAILLTLILLVLIVIRILRVRYLKYLKELDELEEEDMMALEENSSLSSASSWSSEYKAPKQGQDRDSDSEFASDNPEEDGPPRAATVVLPFDDNDLNAVPKEFDEKYEREEERRRMAARRRRPFEDEDGSSEDFEERPTDITGYGRATSFGSDVRKRK